MSANTSSRPSTVFNTNQKSLVDTLIPEFDSFVATHNPAHAKRCKALTDWKKSKATELMARTEFQDVLVNPGSQVSHEYQDWHVAIRRYYTNYYNNKYLRHNHRSATQASHATTPAADKSTHDPNNTVKDFLRRAFIVFSSELTARELFAKENKDLVKEKMNEISSDFPDLSGGPLRQKALKLLWKNEDQEKWEERLEELQNDTQGNQEELEYLMFAALEDLCARKRLGSIMMQFSYAVCDSNDGLKNTTIFMGYDAETNKIISTTPSTSDQDTMLSAWSAFADLHLPRAKRYIPQYTIPVNGNGKPIMPHVDIAKASPEQISVLLHDFLLAVWNRSSFSERYPSIPWEQISASPDSYIDQLAFKLPVPFANPMDLALNPMALYSLYGYFTTISVTTPFQFRENKATNTPESGLSSDLEPLFDPVQPQAVSPGPSSETPGRSPSPPVPFVEEALTLEPPAKPPVNPSPPPRKPDMPPLPLCSDPTPGQSSSEMLPPLNPAPSPSEMPPPHTPAPSGSHSAEMPPQMPPPPQSKTKAPSKRGRGRPKGAAPTRVSFCAKTAAGGESSTSACESLKRPISTSDAGPPKKKVKPGFEYRDANNNLVNKQGQRIDEDGNLLPQM